MTPHRSPRRAPDAGLTLVEVLVALAVFALIGTAGLATLDGILRARERTEGRLEVLAGLQRGLHLVATDLMQASGGSLAATGGTLAVGRQRGPGIGYALEDGAFVRHVASQPRAAPVRQVLVPGASGLAWRFFTPEHGWTENWPPARAEPPGAAPPDGDARAGDATPRNPAAVELTIAFDGRAGKGTLRRLAILPAEVSP